MGNSKGIVKRLMMSQSMQRSISMRYEFNDYRNHSVRERLT